jgi:hypothetical protein
LGGFFHGMLFDRILFVRGLLTGGILHGMLFDRGLFDRGLLTPGAFDWGLLTEEHIPGGLFRGAIVVEPSVCRKTRN